MKLAAIREQIRAHQPELAVPTGVELRAAVALILYQPEGRSAEVLFIERATREGDPWSGHMALPGGRHDATDTDMAATAARETFEEVGVRLDPPIGRLDDFTGSRNPRVPPLIVSPFVYEVATRPSLRINHEVQSTVWIPIDWLLAPHSSIEYRLQREEFSGPFPAVEFEGYVVWGLTYRILTEFFEILGRARDFGPRDLAPRPPPAPTP